MAGSASSAGDPSVYRSGLFIQRLQDSVDTTLGQDYLPAQRLEAISNRMDFFSGHRDARSFRRGLWQVAGKGWSEEGNVRFSGMLCTRILYLLLRCDGAPTVVDLLRIWHRRRHRAGAWIYLTCFDSD